MAAPRYWHADRPVRLRHRHKPDNCGPLPEAEEAEAVRRLIDLGLAAAKGQTDKGQSAN
jgi:hypothetical protein